MNRSLRRSGRPPVLEPLEDRTLMATCHVTRLSDVGAGMGFRGDLRYCINKVNNLPGPDAIDFRVMGTIRLGSALPDLSSEIDIQGPGATLLTVRRTGPPLNHYYRIFTVPVGATVSITGLTVTNGNQVSGFGGYGGGGISNEGTLTVEDCVVIGNRHTSYDDYSRGGGIHNAGVMTIKGTVITQNESLSLILAYGGGVNNAASGELTIIDSTITDNRAEADFSVGGGLTNHGSVSIYGSTISDNETGTSASGGGGNDGSGGGLANEKGVMVVLNSTVTLNRSDFGAGFYTGYQAELTVISHSTISANLTTAESSAGFGIACEVSSPLFMRNNIVAGNPAGDNQCNLTSSGSNLFGNSSGGSGYAPTDILNVDAMLGALADNGGPTLTIALLPGSPAIDAGDNTDAPEFDQRGPGFPRIVNGTIDIGAFEVQATGAPVALRHLAVFITAELDATDGMRRNGGIRRCKAHR